MFKDTSKSVLLGNHVQEFLQKLRQGSVRDAENLLECLGNVELAVILESVEFFIQKLSDEKDATLIELISDNFFILLVGSLDWTRLSVTSELLPHIYQITQAISPQQKQALERMGLLVNLSMILMKESETGDIICAQRNDGLIITTAHFIVDLLPALPSSDCYEDVDNVRVGILFTGPDLMDQNDEHRNLIFILELSLNYIFNICQRTTCHYVYQVLLLKLIFWGNYLQVLTTFVKVGELIALLKTLISSNEQDKVVIGLASVHTLLKNYGKEFHANQLHETIKSSCLFTSPMKWIEDDYEILIADYLKTPKMLIGCINDPAFQTFDKSRELVRSILEYILPNFEKSNENGKTDSELNYSRLTTFMRSILHISKITKHLSERHSVDSDAIKIFGAVVSYVVRLLEQCSIGDLHSHQIQDMECQFTSTNNGYSSPNEINLLSTRSLAFDRVLGPSLSPDQLTNSTLVQVLRLLSILYEVNENWGVLFSKQLLNDRLIDGGAFVSYYVAYSDLRNNEFSEQFVCNSVNYSFLYPYEVRQVIFGKECMLFSSRNRSVPPEITTGVIRNNAANDFVRSILSESIRANPDSYELISKLVESPVREFPKEINTNISIFCQRYDLDLWIGDPINDLSGIVCVNSPSGLFPKPRLSLQQHTALQLKAIGRVMARCIKDGKEIDFNFSKAFYKRLFGVPTVSQEVALSDLKDVMPHVYAFVKKIINVLNMKLEIEKNESLSFEERKKAISDINFDGSSFKDLCINFTIPGFPEFEMKEGGKEIFLSIENVEEYLKLLLWCVLYKGPQIYVNTIIEGFEGVLPVNCLKMFRSEEIEYLLCGEKNETWTVEYLKENCDYSEYLPAIKFLFEFLVSSSASLRGKFLQFVTLSRTLPYGGLKNLIPRIDIHVQDETLPRTNTCSHTLIIPNFSSRNIAEEQFLEAFRHSL